MPRRYHRRGVCAVATDASGLYEAGDLHRGAYTITPSKQADDCEAITPYDTSLILRHSAGLETLSGSALAAADVTVNEAASVYDASFVLRKAAHLIELPFPSAPSSWGFDPVARNYAAFDDDLIGQVYTALLLGDVSGNWADGDDPAAMTAASEARLIVRSSPPDAAGMVTVTIDLETDSEIYSLYLALDYAGDVAQVQVAETGPLMSDWLSAINIGERDHVWAALAGAEPIIGAGRLLMLRMQLATAEAQPQLRITDAVADEGAVPITVLDDEIKSRWFLPFAAKFW
jgi:hypothetical protein